MAEFFFVGALESKRGLPISPNCDKNKTSTPKCQVGFIQFVVGPLYKSAFAYFHGLDDVCYGLDKNKHYWEMMDPSYKLPVPKVRNDWHCHTWPWEAYQSQFTYLDTCTRKSYMYPIIHTDIQLTLTP